jgi:predicted ArsR family transcriptional regulator
MNSQDTALARATDPATSHEAASKVDARTLSERVLECLRKHGAGTAHDIAQRLGISLVSVSPRMRPLVEDGKVRACGRSDGRTVWEAT